MSLDIVIQPTPNPNALKFILNQVVKANGKSSYRDASECESNPMAAELFTIRGVDQIHFFQNVITVSKFGYIEWEEVETKILEKIEDMIEKHNENYLDPNPEEERRRNLTPELLKIEEVLDKTIRPGLQGDGGDLVCLTYEDNVLIIKYEGACGTCPSSTMGTLQAIRGILQEHINPEIEVYTAPEY
jgi:Fe-S cluster biogenesis protein NfuA